MIEALVVDVNTSDMYQLELALFQVEQDLQIVHFLTFTVLFGSESQMSDGLTIQGGGADINAVFSPGGNLFGIRNLGKLPKDFFFEFKPLTKKG